MDNADRSTELEMWSIQINSSVVRVPGRRFPGVVMQGDSLSILFDLAMEVVDMSSKTDDVELRETAQRLARNLLAHLKHYEQCSKLAASIFLIFVIRIAFQTLSLTTT
jgi:uncharacterized protein DUF6959